MFILNVLFNKYMWIARTSSQDIEYFYFLRKGTFVIFPLITDNFFGLHREIVVTLKLAYLSVPLLLAHDTHSEVIYVVGNSDFFVGNIAFSEFTAVFIPSYVKNF